MFLTWAEHRAAARSRSTPVGFLDAVQRQRVWTYARFTGIWWCVAIRVSPAADARTLDSGEELPKVDRKVTSQGPLEWNDKEMSWFKRKSRSVTVNVYVGDALLDVTGESHYQNNLMAIAGLKTEGGYNLAIDAVLVREPDNEYDENAIAVYARVKDADVGALKVGYVARELAVDLAPALDEKNASCTRPGGRPRGFHPRRVGSRRRRHRPLRNIDYLRSHRVRAPHGRSLAAVGIQTT